MKKRDIQVTEEEFKIYLKIIERARKLGIFTKPDSVNDISVMMDIHSANLKFNLRLEDWLNSDDFNFAHDYWGIRDNINRNNGFPARDFGLFVPRFASKVS